MILRGRIVRVSGPASENLFLVTLRLPRQFDDRVFWTREPWLAALCEGFRQKREQIALSWDDNRQILSVGLPVADAKEPA